MSRAKRQRIEAIFDTEQLGRVWLHVFPNVRLRRLLLLGSTNRFFSALVNEYLESLTPQVHPAFGHDRKAISLSQLLHRCFICRHRTVAEFDLVPGMHLCARCKHADPRVITISPTETKKRFHLKLQDLNGLACVDYWLPEYKQQCKAFLLIDVQKRALEIYGSEEAIAEVQRKTAERKAKLAATKQRKQEEAAQAEARRKQELLEELEVQGLAWADDPLRCQSYVVGLEGTLNDVITAIRVTKILAEQCNFPARWKAYLDRQPWMGLATMRESRRRMREELFEQWKLQHSQ